MDIPARVTWVIVANAERCRIFEERRYGGELRELTAWERRRTDEDSRLAHHEKAVEHQRFGFGQAVVNERDFERQAERRFLARCARELELAAAKDCYERLILIAPPRALGILREELGRAARERVEGADPCACIEESAEALRQRIHRLRSR